jgi:hypothetical protein
LFRRTFETHLEPFAQLHALSLKWEPLETEQGSREMVIEFAGKKPVQAVE